MLLAEHQISVRHALMALGAAHEAFVCVQSPLSSFTLCHYNKAIRTTMGLVDAWHPQAEEAALLMSIIFASLEVLRGCYHSAFKIITSATNILQRHAASGRNRNLILPGVGIRHMFMRLMYQTMDLRGSEISHHSHYYESDLPETFDDLDRQ